MTTKPLSHLGDMPIATFLTEYWQQKPLFIKNAFKDWQAPLSGDDLASLALDETVESRLIVETPSTNPLFSQWQLEHGPLAEERFETLPQSHFTLLVQALDQMCPDIHELLHNFRFIPNWRLDDVMGSAAPKGGSVGPHFDYYDVFLLQATGTRHWQLGQTCSTNTPLQDNCPLKILTTFDTSAEYLAEPGDLLYIPANIAHWGISQSDDCTTYSIGFRAPSYSDILLDLSQEIASQLSSDERYRDTVNTFSDNPGAIPHAVALQIAQRCQQLFTPERVSAWLGKHLTEAKRDLPDVITHDFEPAGPVLAAHVRAAYTEPAETNNTQNISVYIDGTVWSVSLPLARQLCGYTVICPEDYSPADQAVIEQWIDHDFLSLPNTAHPSTAG